jgi:hypothetical protein
LTSKLSVNLFYPDSILSGGVLKEGLFLVLEKGSLLLGVNPLGLEPHPSSLGAFNRGCLSARSVKGKSLLRTNPRQHGHRTLRFGNHFRRHIKESRRLSLTGFQVDSIGPRKERRRGASRLFDDGSRVEEGGRLASTSLQVKTTFGEVGHQLGNGPLGLGYGGEFLGRLDTPSHFRVTHSRKIAGSVTQLRGRTSTKRSTHQSTQTSSSGQVGRIGKVTLGSKLLGKERVDCALDTSLSSNTAHRAGGGTLSQATAS